MEDGTSTGDEGRVAELLRVNAELAAELRGLRAGQREPRLGQLPAARQLAQLRAERDELSAELETIRGERDGLRRERNELLGRTAELERETARLRIGLGGLLRRLRARLLRL